MFVPAPPPDAERSIRLSLAQVTSSSQAVRKNCISLALLAALTSTCLIVCFIFPPPPAEAQTKYTLFLPDGTAVSAGGTAFPTAPSIQLTTVAVTVVENNEILLPAPGETTTSDIPANVSLSYDPGEYSPSSTTPIPLRFSVRSLVSEPPSDVASLSSELLTGTWEIELLAMEVSGELTGPDGPAAAILRESPTLQSLGQHNITELPGDLVQIHTFFDVFFELSLGGGPFVPADGPVRFEHTVIVPEPGMAALVAAAIAALSVTRRRYRRV